MLTLTCSIEGLMHNLDQTVSFIWRGPRGSILVNSAEIQSDNNIFNSSLTFSSLLTSYGGHYTCEAPEFDIEGTTLVVVDCTMICCSIV